MTLQVLLVRHGRPLCDERTPIRGLDFGAWVQAYDDAQLDTGLVPQSQLQEQAGTFSRIMTSTLRRSVESARMLVGQRMMLADAVFNEAPIPTNIRLRLRLLPLYWDVLMRVAWLFGLSNGTESLRAAKERAAIGANRLAFLAREHGSVLLVGHGMMNWLLAKELQRAGWKGTRPRGGYWSSTTLTWHRPYRERAGSLEV